MSMEQIELRKRFAEETETTWINSQGEPDLDYVIWLENKVLGEPMNWIKTEDKPLVTVDDQGNWEATEAGMETFLAYKQVMENGKLTCWIQMCELADEMGLCISTEFGPEPAGWDATDITHYCIIKSPDLEF